MSQQTLLVHQGNVEYTSPFFVAKLLQEIAGNWVFTRLSFFFFLTRFSFSIVIERAYYLATLRFRLIRNYTLIL